MAQTPDGTPYVEGSDFVSGYPAVSQALAEQIDALRRMQPVGMIAPYAGELNSADDLAAIDGWLPCDGKAYKRGDFPDLYARMSPWQVHTGFPPDTPGGSPNTANFYVPDFRGRAPFGVAGNVPTTDADIAAPFTLGQRYGDARVPSHFHDIVSGAYGVISTNAGPNPNSWNIGSHTNSDTDKLQAIPRAADKADAQWPIGLGRNVPPGTGVNFIVWTGTTTVGKSPISGVEVSPVTRRMMIEARLEDAGITEEEMEMLREQLAALKDGEK